MASKGAYSIWKGTRRGLCSDLSYSVGSTVADTDLQLKVGPDFDLLALLAFLPSFVSSFLSKIGGGGLGPRAPPLDLPLIYISISNF